MSGRAAARLAWTLLAVIFLLNVVGVTLLLWDRPPDTQGHPFDPLVVLVFAFALVGGPVAAQLPRNPIGWILLAIGGSWSLYALAQGYAFHAVVSSPGSLPRPDLMLALVGSWSWVPAVGLMGTFLILLFPDGHLLSPRWRWWARLSAFAMASAVAVSVLTPGSFVNDGFPQLRNPLGLDISSAVGVLVALVPICIVGSAVSLVKRFRRSQGRERLQLKWLATSGAVVATFYLLFMATLPVLNVLGLPEQPKWAHIWEQVALYPILLIPVSIGMAVLRFRLYDIDRLVSRTVTYALVTALLGTPYLLVVPLVTRAISSDLAVAAATLGVAALFNPARRRVQSVVDRRFNRTRYDAVRTVDAFSARLRDQVDLDQLSRDLLAVVHRTMQPAHASLWLRGTP